mmetsp:Transcript_32749/g.45737  ORF Transcript_32749/g.45737 Transcript_32749/m.45737 type:complete len:230 (+) Transcript_32749:95-784(+)|eukprot:jgi/Bigna1/91024/estExt_fgenesh1_pg.C_860018
MPGSILWCFVLGLFVAQNGAAGTHSLRSKSNTPLRTRFIHSGAVLGRENARRSLNCRGSCARNIEGIILFSVRESRQSSLRSKRRREQLRANGLFGQIEKPRIIAQTLRTSIATLLNTVVDIPLIGEVEEQILFTKIVDVVSDLIEDWMIESMGNGANILGELERMDQAKLDVWRDKVVDDLNGKIDLPILNEDQEAPIIRFIVDKYLDSSLKGGYAYSGGRKKFLGIF